MQLVREYVQLELLRRLSSSMLKRHICFKGGTAFHLIYNMDRYSEDLDFSLSSEISAQEVMNELKSLFKNEDITDSAIKRKTVLLEIRQAFTPQNFRVKLEINTDNIVPTVLKNLFSLYMPHSFNLQVMRADYLVAQKIRALLQRNMGRDIYDLWFILRTRLSIDFELVGQLVNLPTEHVREAVIKKVGSWKEKNIANDLNPFIDMSRREWIKTSLKSETLELLMTI